MKQFILGVVVASGVFGWVIWERGRRPKEEVRVQPTAGHYRARKWRYDNWDQDVTWQIETGGRAGGAVRILRWICRRFHRHKVRHVSAGWGIRSECAICGERFGFVSDEWIYWAIAEELARVRRSNETVASDPKL